MPEMDGFETAELMRSSEITRNIPIVFVTALYKEQKYIFKGYEIGAVDYLFKPIEAVILRSKVNVFLELNKQKRKLKEQTDSIRRKLEELQELQEANKELQSLSNLDGLTNITNRRRFDEYIKVIWNDSLRNNTPLSIIMIDIDDFNSFNDNYGHIQGDDCLITVAQKLLNSIECPRDVIARYGGEEFAVILSETDVEGASFVAEMIRRNIEGLQIPHRYSQASPFITISLGVYSNIPNNSSSIENYIAKADAALYDAKSLGRNRVCKSKE
jgi:diguanylate cyclase (GGDEF)-like protein